MTTFMLWNVGRRPLDGLLVELVQKHKVDVLMLVEHFTKGDALLHELKATGDFHRIDSYPRFGVYVKFDPSKMQRLSPPTESTAGDRADFWSMELDKRNKLLLALVHGLDMRNHDARMRSLFFNRLRDDVLWMEGNDPKVLHKRTVVLGDFNANPFDSEIGGTDGLHAIRLKEVGGKASRSVIKRDHEFFCNPMWSCCNGWDKPPPGTYYFNRNRVHELFWHLFDQVVLRPQALHMFSERNLKVLGATGGTGLVSENGLPKASDHLPVLFKLNFKARRK
ncbi:MAG: endonuclease/exonuclease/phosphatase family protein [Planctomycetia bacterium]